MITQTASVAAQGSVADSLEPVRTALLADAAVSAQQILAEADRAATALIAEVERDAEAEIDKARRRNELSAQASVDRVLARVRNDAQAVVLGTQEQLHQRLIEAVHAAALALREDHRYAELLDHLEALARTQLGSAAVIERDPVPDGGVIAVMGGRRVDYTLRAVSDRALDTLADEVALLWK